MLARILPIAAIVVVVVGVLLAFKEIGTPSHARLVQLDTARARDAQAIVDTLHSQFGRSSSSLPPTIAHIPLGDRYAIQLRDPQTNALYEYHRLSAHRYQLCINFSTPTDPNDTDAYVSGWHHTKPGRDCQIFDTTS